MRFLFLGVILLSGLGALYGQQESDASKSKDRIVLLAFEESNEKIDPWLERFRKVLRAENVHFEEKAAKELATTDLAKYDLIIIYGAVMAFTAKEPLRDWLSKEPRLSGMKVGLLVTANRWFLGEYYAQLTDLLKNRKATMVDAVSAATEALKEDAKDKILMDFVDTLNPERIP